MTNTVEQIANRHIARCLSKIKEVHKLPEVCVFAIKQEMHYCAEDVADSTKQVTSETDNDTKWNR